jgi:hypothetical protein
MKILQFELFAFYCWLINGEIDEFKIDFFRIGNRSLLRYSYETACATDVSILFLRFEIFTDENGKKYWE